MTDLTDPVDLASKSVEAGGRSGVYGLLAAVFAAEPTERLLDALRGPTLHSALMSLGVDLSGLIEANSSDAIEANAIEYARLFIGPGKHVYPYGSMYINGEGSLWGGSTERTSSFFTEAGFEPPANLRNPPDHIAAELEFLRLLTLEEAYTAADGRREAWREIQALQRCFLQSHLLPWADRFFDAVAENTDATLYREFALLAKSFLAMEREFFSDMDCAPSPSFGGIELIA